MNHSQLHLAAFADICQIKALTLHSHQEKYAGTGENLAAQALNKNNQLFIITCNKHIIGGFYLDFAKQLYQKEINKNSSCCTLRAMIIDKRHQGKGLAQAALAKLQPLTHCYFPVLESIGLTVNCKNSAAKKVYLGCGFEDTKKRYYGGNAGPQAIYTLFLKSHQPCQSQHILASHNNEP
ncbi:hypothetical protein PsalN5692_03247 [Piscirickettsia salmonis]|nr:hypothetical protein PsalN5692_03247 [Piscirickettsia salmonis]